MKSHAQDIFLAIATETLVDAYACLSELTQNYKADDYTRDKRYIEGRYNFEGIAFLTKALPTLGEFLDRILCGTATERVVGFKPYDGLYPCFLRPFWMYIQSGQFSWTPETARLIRILRTFLFGFKKLNVPFSADQVKERLDSFLEIEKELDYSEIVPSASLQRAQELLEMYTYGYNPICEHPKHGPGAVSGGERGNRKWTWSVLYESVHAEYPYYDYVYGVRTVTGNHWPAAFPSQTGKVPLRVYPLQLAQLAREYKNLKRLAFPVARLLFVPKDSRGPRVISCEPKELMYLQQGVAGFLMKYIEKHVFTRGHVNFERQDVNYKLALESSKSKEWDTIDLSDASDRVGCKLIQFLYPERITKKWLALRSAATRLPDGSVVMLNKFAPMGSALCFPVESLTFWAIAVGSVWEQTDDLDVALSSVYVYGDDIIIASGYTERVMHVLESVGLRVNRNKSFIGQTPFRESCGIEAYEGFDVTPLRIKKFPPQRPSDGDAGTAWVKYAENSQYISPYRSKLLLSVVERVFGPIPRVPHPQPFLSFVTNHDHWGIERYFNAQWSVNDSYWKAKLWVCKPKKRFDPLDPLKRIQHALNTRLESDPSFVVDRLSTQTRKLWTTITYLGA